MFPFREKEKDALKIHIVICMAMIFINIILRYSDTLVMTREP